MLKKILILLLFSSCPALAKDYRITFSDSGVGGLIFALDVLSKIEPELEKLQSDYEVNFIVHHIGDSANLPYSSKGDDELRVIVEKLVRYQMSLPHAETNVLACNTASTMVDQEMRRKFDKELITMIDLSAEELIIEAGNGIGAIFATERTIRSGKYQELVKNNISYSPKRWAADIENGIVDDKFINETLLDFQAKNPEKFGSVKAVGLFCTHYPLYAKQIKSFFGKNGNKKVSVISQGAIFSGKIIAEIKEKVATRYPKRVAKSCSIPVQIVSEFSSDEIEKALKVTRLYGKKYSKRILFRINSFGISN